MSKQIKLAGPSLSRPLNDGGGDGDEPASIHESVVTKDQNTEARKLIQTLLDAEKDLLTCQDCQKRIATNNGCQQHHLVGKEPCQQCRQTCPNCKKILVFDRKLSTRTPNGPNNTDSMWSIIRVYRGVIEEIVAESMGLSFPDLMNIYSQERDRARLSLELKWHEILNTPATETSPSIQEAERVWDQHWTAIELADMSLYHAMREGPA